MTATTDFDIHAKQDLAGVEKKWEQFQDENDISKIEDIDERILKEEIEKDLGFVSKMTVQEYTLFQKWQEVQRKYPTTETHGLFGTQKVLDDAVNNKIGNVRNNIWIPESPEDYEKLEPVLEFTDDHEIIEKGGQLGAKTENKRGKTTKLNNKSETWNTLRTFLSTMKNNSNIGRQLFFNVKDNKSDKHLGVICISGDFMDLTPRDSAIGWDRQSKTFGGMINHTAIGSSIVPTQPLGYSYTGGKLLAYLCLSDIVQNLWKEKYGDHLVGVTTTSLYGKSKTNTLSQYDGLKYWKKMGFTMGSVSYEPQLNTKNLIKQWLKKNHTRKYFEWYEATRANGQPLKRDHKNRSYMFTYSRLGIPKEYIKTDHARGIYFARLYNNTYEFLRGEVKEDQLDKRFDNSTEALVNVWKNKHAKNRVKNLLATNRFSYDSHFYDDLIYLDWEQCKEKYLNQVGR
tara:strand:- start:893 stop:2260 length:1368 start_codon:yes stop_codon:yes gene_type:complete